MIYKLSDDADKFLEKKYKKDRTLYHRLLDKIDEIIKDPYKFEYLKGKHKYRKARVGDYRIIFSISIDKQGNPYCFILLIELRKKSYKIFNRKVR